MTASRRGDGDAAEGMVRILVVDDNTLIRKVLRAALEAEGHACTEAANGADAIRSCHENPPEACLLDLNLPDLDGLAVLGAIKEEERTRSTRVFLLTGSSEPNLAARARRLGAEACLAKPVTASGLAALLRGG